MTWGGYHPMMREASLSPPLLPARVKPRLRGASHLVAFFAALVGGGLLTWAAPSGVATVAALVYGLTLVAMFGASALYHVPMWSKPRLQVLRRVDHATIFLLIAGTYTPFCLLALPEPLGHRMLLVIWAGAGLGIIRAVAWLRPPRWLTSTLYVALGWVAVFSLPEFHAAVGWSGVATLLGGGLLYSLGAVVYAVRRPDPLPKVFGYHEVFHLMVIAASALHFATVQRVVL
jgi:hemolysin III